MTRTYALIAAASMAMLAACSGSDGQVRVSGPDPVTAPSITSTPDTTQPEPDSTTPETVATTNITTTTPAPTTTLDPIAEIEAAVQQARLDGQAAFAAAESDPTDQRARAELATYQTGARLSAAVADLDELAEDGLAVRAGEPNLSRIVFSNAIVLLDGVASTEAFLEECRVNSDVLYTIAQNDEQIEAVVDDQVFSYLSNLRYVFEDGRWKHESGKRLNRIAGSDAC